MRLLIVLLRQKLLSLELNVNMPYARRDPPPEDWTPIHAIQWCAQKSQRVKIGHNDYLEVLVVLRKLVAERIEHKKEMAKLEAEIARLTAPPPKKVRVPFDVGGNGQWG